MGHQKSQYETLTRFSSVFRDALSIPPIPSGKHSSDDSNEVGLIDQDFVDLDLTDNEMELLVVILNGEKITASHYKDVSLKRFLDVCDTYDLHTVQELVLARHVAQSFEISDDEVWDCFCIAARNDNLPAAKKLISQLERTDGFCYPAQALTDAMTNACPRAYLLELFIRIGCVRPHGDGYVGDWKAVAGNFQPR